MHREDRATRRFRGFALATVATIYALILVGGIVRATGAGMGCPDWPTCFGQWIPPTDVSQLPPDYQTIYADRGYAETTFNVVKTWTEYLNRLLGAFTGFTILVTLLFAWPLKGRESGVFTLSLAAFVLVGVQGWLGARVVASNLAPGMITVHMLLAQVIVGLVIAAVLRTAHPLIDRAAVRALPRSVAMLLVVAMVAGLVQLVVGTQVREAVDLVARANDHADRHLWIESLPVVFGLHKWLALPLVALNGWLAWSILSSGRSPILKRLNVALVALMLGTIAIGMSMDRLHLPIFAQPLHLFFGSLIFGVQLAILLVLRPARARQAEVNPREQHPLPPAAAHAPPGVPAATRGAAPPVS